MKKIFAILIVSMMICSNLCFAQEEINNEPQLPVRPIFIPTIFSNKENACSIEEPCNNVEEEEIAQPQKTKKVKKEKVKKEKVKKEKVKKEKVERKMPDILSIFKPEWETSGKKEKVDVEKFLNLTENQINAAKQNRIDGEEQIKPYMDEIKIREKKIKNIEFQNAPSEARDKQVERYYLEIKEIDKEADKIRKENQENFEKLLTPEQLELFKQITKPQEQSKEGEENL